MSRYPVLLAVIFWMPACLAGDFPARLLDCRALTDPQARLACYDRIPAPAASDAPQPATPRNGAGDAELRPEDLFGKDSSAQQALVARQLNLRPVNEIRSRVIRVDQGARRTHIVHLENGQIWQQKHHVGGWRVRAGDTIVIDTALMGSFRMKIDGRNKAVGVKRLQ